MAGNPRIVTEDVTFTWDGASQRLARGTLIDVPPGSELEQAIGPDHLVPLGAVAAQPPAEEAPQEESQATSRKPRSTAKNSDDKDGDA